jgi:predicted NBD/HSP70 family sugar kinase
MLVASVERSSLGVGLADLKSRILFEHHEALDPIRDPGTVLRRLHALFDWAREQQDRPVWGVGLGVPAGVESRLGDVARPDQAKGGTASALNEAYGELLLRYRAPVVVRSTVQMAALGEVDHLRPSRRDEVIYVELGREITAAAVWGGRVQRGALGIAGQLGHTYSGEARGERCRCGNVGCLETLAGADALLSAASRAADANARSHLARLRKATGQLEIGDIGAAVRLGDVGAAAILAQAGRAIGTVLASLTNALNPATIVIAGELAESGEILLAAIREALYRHAHPLVTRDLNILRSVMSRSAGLAGAALTVVDELMRPDFIAGWIEQGTPLKHPSFLARLSEQKVAQ